MAKAKKPDDIYRGHQIGWSSKQGVNKDKCRKTVGVYIRSTSMLHREENGEGLSTLHIDRDSTFTELTFLRTSLHLENSCS